MVRVRRIELRSQVWKTHILTVVLHPRACKLYQLLGYNKKHKENSMKISRFSNNLNDTSLHTSGFAEVANGNAMGASSSQSFAQRKQLERQRQHIGGSRQSMMGRAYGQRPAMKPRERIESVPSQGQRQSANIPAPSPAPASSCPWLRVCPSPGAPLGPLPAGRPCVDALLYPCGCFPMQCFRGPYRRLRAGRFCHRRCPLGYLRRMPACP